MSNLVAIDSTGKRAIRWSEVIKLFVAVFALLTIVNHGMDLLLRDWSPHPDTQGWGHAVGRGFMWSVFIVALQIGRARKQPHARAAALPKAS